MPRLKQCALWLGEAKWTSLTLALTIGIISFCIKNGSECAIRYSGLFLQMSGTLFVIWTISDTRKLFGKPSASARFVSWLQRCPCMGGKPAKIYAEGIASAEAVSKVSAKGHFIPNDDALVEEKIRALFHAVDSIWSKIRETDNRINSSLEQIGKQIDTLNAAHHSKTSELSKRLEDVGVGNMDLTFLGATWMLLGTFLSTAAPEIARILL